MNIPPPNYREQSIALYLGDCIDVIDRLVKKEIKVNTLLTDPPYNVSRKNNFKTMGRKGIDFGEWDKDFDIVSWLKNIDKVICDNGSIIIFNTWQNLYLIQKTLEEKGFIYKQLIRWVKNNPMPRNRDRLYINDCEYAIWMIKGKWIFNRLDDKYQRPELKSGITTNQVHPTQKNLNIIEELIKIHSNENDVVLDCFLGSGTTGVACKKLNRKFIGIEKDKTYFDIAVKRIQEITVPEKIENIA